MVNFNTYSKRVMKEKPLSLLHRLATWETVMLHCLNLKRNNYKKHLLPVSSVCLVWKI